MRLPVLLLAVAGCSALQKPAGVGEVPLLAELQALARGSPAVVAHRGDSDAFPENTLAAFRSALRAGAQLVELDFHQSRDGVLVCMHDRELDRTTDVDEVAGRKKVKVSDLTSAELSKLDAGSWKGERFQGTAIPTVAEALEAIGKGAIAMVEHKEGDPEKLIDLLRGMDLLDDVLVQSFDWEWLEEARRLEPRLALAALGEGRLDAETLERLRRTGAIMVHWRSRDLLLEDIELLHRLGYLVAIYTVDDDLGLLGGAAAGADFITTNRPGRLRRLIDSGRLRPGRRLSGRRG